MRDRACVPGRHAKTLARRYGEGPSVAESGIPGPGPGTASRTAVTQRTSSASTPHRLKHFLVRRPVTQPSNHT